ncbi:MAG: elongator complex protein 3 [Anaerolineales bacterium]|jgi:elongator complex protein 3
MTEMKEERKQAWLEARRLSPERMETARQALEEIRAGRKVFDAIRRNPLPEGGYLGKHMLVKAYRELVARGEWPADPQLIGRIRMKPMRTLSGVTTVTVLTKPYPCPGKCIFCPTDIRMPKSYLPDEPGAMRALNHQFDPYDQVEARIEALNAVGHPTNKIELLILGGTWSSYRKDYQEWFLLECFRAMNQREFATLEEAQKFNETAGHRNVGLVIETRPDHIDPKELAWLRRLGVTKVQLGAQSLDDGILALNHRGHTLTETRQAVAYLRAAGFKIVLHWMPNLLGATLASDRADFLRLWEGLCPDELKIYPTQLLENAELYDYWQRGEYTPYTTEELIDLLADIKTTIPRYCRVNRIIRDIPSTNVVAGNRRTSLRMDVHREMERRGTRCQCVRCREVRGKKINPDDLKMEDLLYAADGAEEHFISFVTPDDKLAGFLRLSLPRLDAPQTGLADLEGAALIREVHVYGQSLEVGKALQGAAQHLGLGTALLHEAERIARQHGYRRTAVIAAVGTRRYYLGRGYKRGELYLVKELGGLPDES